MGKGSDKLKSLENNVINFSKKERKREKKKLQRTKIWREERRGNWTGSQLKNLMSCGQGKGRLAWDNLDRLFSFGLTSIKYIYENAMERKTGRYIDDGEGTWQMQYGTKVEPLIQKATKAKLKEMGVKGKIKSVGYKSFSGIPNAGVSSDSILIDKNGKTIATVEMKACTSWQTHYDRTFDLTSEKSKDFWQIQGQTIAHEVEVCYYVVAEPPSDIKKYLFYQGDIMEMYEEFCKECKISIEIVNSSKLHCEALIKRITMAEDGLNDWLSIKGAGLKQQLDKTVMLYEKDPTKLNKYIAPLPFINKRNPNFFSKKKTKRK
jgi:hypothetical protein